MSKTMFSLDRTTEAKGSKDFFPTPEKATQDFLDLHKFDGFIYEPACGKGDMSRVLIKNGYTVTSSDVEERGYGSVKNFFDYKSAPNIVTNPPYSLANEFVSHGLSIVEKQMALLLSLNFLTSKGRYKSIYSIPENRPNYIYIYSYRIPFKLDDYDKPMNSLLSAWLVWEKGNDKETITRWI